VTELTFEVPCDYTNPEKGLIQLFGRSVRKDERPAAESLEEQQKKSKSPLPWFVYLQGGPGFGCPSPQSSPITKTVLDRGYQLLFLDQRGTGLSR